MESPEMASVSRVIVIPNWTSPRLITTFLFPLNNNKMPKPVIIMQIPQPTHCSEIVLIEN